MVAYGQWSLTEAAKSSTWWELMAIWHILLSVSKKLKCSRVRWFTDSYNQNVAHTSR